MRFPKMQANNGPEQEPSQRLKTHFHSSDLELDFS